MTLSSTPSSPAMISAPDIESAIVLRDADIAIEKRRERTAIVNVAKRVFVGMKKPAMAVTLVASYIASLLGGPLSIFGGMILMLFGSSLVAKGVVWLVNACHLKLLNMYYDEYRKLLR
jgi:hypothetical protein